MEEIKKKKAKGISLGIFLLNTGEKGVVVGKKGGKKAVFPSGEKEKKAFNFVVVKKKKTGKRGDGELIKPTEKPGKTGEGQGFLKQGELTISYERRNASPH